MLAKVIGVLVVSMPARAMLARTIRPGKEHARRGVADITTYIGIPHPTNLSNNKVSGTWCSNKGGVQPRNRHDNGNSALGRAR
jgi:hypothetical protein